MPPRRSHAKSRRGCVNCKSRHIKCDEGGPPCERCKTRGTTCEYITSGSAPKAPSPAEVQKVSPSEGVTTKANPVKLPADHRLLELQLMHRWSTCTYKSCVTPQANDEELWEQKVPVLAVQYDFCSMRFWPSQHTTVRGRRPSRIINSTSLRRSSTIH